MKKTGKVTSSIAVILILILSLIGCSRQEVNNFSEPGSTGEAATVTEGVTTTEEEKGGDKTLTVGVLSVADQPFNPGNIALPFLEQLQPIYDSLLRIDSAGNYIPGLATEWALAADKLSYTLKLREGVKFQDGSDLTSADVKFSLEYYTSEDSTQADKNLLVKYIKSIDTPDDYTVVVNFTKPFTEFDYLISEGGTGSGIIIPKAYFEKVGAQDFAANPIGTGPFKLASFSAGNEIVFEANKDYWQGAPSYGKLIFRQIKEESTRVSELQAGNIDFAPIGVTSSTIFSKDANIKIETVDYNSTLGIFISGASDDTGAATQNPLVREALSLAINREELVKGLFEGKAVAQGAWGVFPFTSGYETERAVPEYNQEKAKQLLQEAGYPDKFKNPVINFYDTAGKVYSSEVVQVIAGYWQAIGVQVNIISTDAPTLGSLYGAKPLSKEFSGSVYLFDPPKKYSAYDAFQAFYPSASKFGLIQNQPDFDQNVADLLTLDGGDRAALVDKILTQIDEAKVSIPLVYPSQNYAVSSKIEKWDPGYAAHWGNWFYTFTIK